MKNEIKPRQKFGHLTTLSCIKTEPPVWSCKCDCGKICYIKDKDLRYNRVKSCGCLRYSAMKPIGDITSIKLDPYYRKWTYHKSENRFPEFSNFQDFKTWYIKQEKEKAKNRIPEKIKDQWRNCISKDQNGDFESLNDYWEWVQSKGYISKIHQLHKRKRNLPYSKKNIEFGFFYEKTFLSIYKCKKYHFCYDRNKNLFYGYIKYKDKHYTTDKYLNFENMLQEYKEIYKTLFHKNFKFT